MIEEAKYEIIFLKWRDPFGADTERHEFNVPYSEDDEDDEQVTMEEKKTLMEDMLPKRATPFLATSIGMIPLTEYTDPGKIFNFWVGHSNFNLTEPVCKAIAEVDGVETLNILTRYRFRIGLGHMFTKDGKDGDALRAIRKAAIDAMRRSNVYKNIS